MIMVPIVVPLALAIVVENTTVWLVPLETVGNVLAASCGQRKRAEASCARMSQVSWKAAFSNRPDVPDSLSLIRILPLMNHNHHHSYSKTITTTLSERFAYCIADCIYWRDLSAQHARRNWSITLANPARFATFGISTSHISRHFWGVCKITAFGPLYPHKAATAFVAWDSPASSMMDDMTGDECCTNRFLFLTGDFHSVGGL